MMTFTVKDKDTIINDILANLVTNVTEITDLNPGAVTRQIVESLATELSDTDKLALYQQLQEVFDGTRIDTAATTDLDQLGLLVGVTRKAGTKATGNITFSRNQVATADFTIGQGLLVSTSPNTGEDQLSYEIVADTIFDAAITVESHLFRDGIFEYQFVERLVSSITQISATVSATPGTILTPTTDFVLTTGFDGTLIDASSITILDSCDVTTDWISSTDATTETVEATDLIEGVGALKLGKSGTASEFAFYEKTLGGTNDVVGFKVMVSSKIIDGTALAKIKNLHLYFASGGSITNSFKLTISNADLTSGSYVRHIIDFTDTADPNLLKTGDPNTSAINFLRFEIETNDASDTLTTADVLMDFWIFGTTTSYEGDIITFVQAGTNPDDNTNYLADYIPLSKEVACQSIAIGTKFNVAKKKVDFKQSVIANVDNVLNFLAMANGTDAELDDALRSRIKSAVEAAAKATVEAIRQAVLAVDGIVAVTADDLPLNTATDEPHTFLTGTDLYKLDFEVAIDNANLVVTGFLSSSPVTFVKDTDYQLLTASNQLDWSLGGDDPDDDTIIEVDYDYNFLGHLDLVVVGQNIPFGPAVNTLVQTAVDDSRSAGIVVTFAEPTVVIQNTDIDILADTANGFTVLGLTPAIETALTAYYTALEPGEDIFIAAIIDTVMDITGVLNTVVNTPAADVTITTTQVARIGTIVVGSL